MTNKKEIIEQSQDQIAKTKQAIKTTQGLLNQRDIEIKKEGEIQKRLADNIKQLFNVKDNIKLLENETVKMLYKVNQTRANTLNKLTTIKKTYKKLKMCLDDKEQKELETKQHTNFLMLLKAIDKQASTLETAKQLTISKINLLRKQGELSDIIYSLTKKREKQQEIIDGVNFLLLEGERVAHLGSVKAFIEKQETPKITTHKQILREIKNKIKTATGEPTKKQD